VETSFISAWRITKGRPRALSTPEGHNVEYDAGGRIVGMTLTNVRWLLDRDGQLTITLPAGHASPGDLAQALKPAA
jgi:YD repeat-containing protein